MTSFGRRTADIAMSQEEEFNIAMRAYSMFLSLAGLHTRRGANCSYGSDLAIAERSLWTVRGVEGEVYDVSHPMPFGAKSESLSFEK